MRLVDKTLYIEFADFLSAGWKEDTVWKANHRNGPFWLMIRNPDDKRMPLVQYDTLRPKDKQRLTDHFGDPFEYMSKQPIKKLVETDFKANAFYVDFVFDGNKKLTLDKIRPVPAC